MKLFKLAFLQNPLAWLYLLLGVLFGAVFQYQFGEHSTVVGAFLMAFMVEVLRFLPRRNDFIDDLHRKEYLVMATGNFFAALFGSIIGVLVV